jgi:hypothetical protein
MLKVNPEELEDELQNFVRFVKKNYWEIGETVCSDLILTDPEILIKAIKLYTAETNWLRT